MNYALRLLRSHLGMSGTKFTDGNDDFNFENPFICFGGGGKGSSGNTTTSTTSPPLDVQQNYDQIMAQAKAAAGTPLQQYSGQTVAPFNSTENSAFGTINNVQGMSQPYINSAAGLINQGTQPLWSGVQQFSPSAISQYSSPYTNQVYNAQVAQEGNTDAQQQSALQGNTISSGAWGGDRAGVASAILSGQQDLANNATNAGILNQGYTQALGEFNTQQQSQLGANEANSYLDQQGAFGMANLGNEAENSALTGANAQLASGQLQQQETQANLNVPYEQFLQQQAYPFQTTQYLAGIDSALSGEEGGTSTTTTPAASSASQYAGLGLGGLGILGSTGAFGGSGGSSGWLSSLFSSGAAAARGGRIQKYASGGSTTPGAMPDPTTDGITSADMPPDLSVSFVPSTAGFASGHQLGLPQAPKAEASSQNSGVSTGDLSNIVKAISSFKSPSTTSPNNSNIGGFGNVFGNNSGIDSSTGNSLATQNSLDNSFLSPGDVGSAGIDFSGGFKRGGRTKGYAFGGDILPIIGDIAGSFYGDPGAGNQAQSIAGLLGLKRGGRAGYDDGGIVGGASPMTAGSAVMNPTQQSSDATYSSMPVQQLQQLVQRLPAGSPQATTANRVLQQKRMMPNVGTPATNGFSATQPQQGGMGTAQASPMLARGGMAKGYDDGGNIPPPPTPDDIGRQLDVQSDVNSDPGANAPGALGANTPLQGLGSTSVASSSDDAPTTSRPNARANPWLALADAGFAMAAGNSPHALQNIGAGATAGIKNYGQQQQEADSVNQSADKLAQEAKSHKDQIAIEQQQRDLQKQQIAQTGDYQQGMLGNQQGELDLKRQQLAADTAYKQQALEQGKYDIKLDPFGNIIKTNTKTGETTTQPGAMNTPATPNADGSAGVSMMNAYKRPTDASGKPISDDAYVASVPAQVGQRAQQIVSGNYQVTPYLKAKDPVTAAAENMAFNLDPSYTDRRYGAVQDFDTKQQGNSTRAFNVATAHLALYGDLADAMNNGDTKLVNTLANKAKTELGLSSAPNTAASLAQLVAGEVVKATTATNGALGDRETLLSNLSNANSPALIHDAINNAYLPAMRGQLQGLEQQYKAATGLNNYRDKYLLPEARQALKLDAPTENASGPAPSSVTAIPQSAIDHLRQNPALAPAFESKYGTSASQYLGGLNG